MINWQDVIVNAVASIGGAGVCVFAAGWILKAIITDRLKANADAEIERVKNALASEAKSFEIQLKSTAETEIERTKAFLIRASRVHERQLDILGPLYDHLYKAKWCFQRMTAKARFEGEISPEGYEPECAAALQSAHEVFSRGRLLIPFDLAKHVDLFFVTAFNGRLDFSLPHDPKVSPAQRANLWDDAALAHQQIRQIMKQIEQSARSVIHGEPT